MCERTSRPRYVEYYGRCSGVCSFRVVRLVTGRMGVSSTVRRVHGEMSVISLLSRQVPLGHTNTSFGTYYPFRGRGAPSFVMSPSHESFRYFNYNTSNSIFGFLVLSSKVAFVRSIGTLTLAYNIRVGRQRSPGTGREGGLVGLRNRLTSFFDHYLMRVGRTSVTHGCLDSHGVGGGIVSSFHVKCIPGGDRMVYR